MRWPPIGTERPQSTFQLWEELVKEGTIWECYTWMDMEFLKTTFGLTCGLVFLRSNPRTKTGSWVREETMARAVCWSDSGFHVRAWLEASLPAIRGSPVRPLTLW